MLTEALAIRELPQELFLAQRIQPKPINPVHHEQLSITVVFFPRLNTFFDAVELIVERSERLITKSKSLFIALALLEVLIIDLYVFTKFLLSHLQ